MNSSNSTSANLVFAQLSEDVRRMPAGRTLRPRVLAKQAGIETWQALAIFRMLEEAGLGAMQVQVGDPRRAGMPIHFFRSAASIPGTLPDAMGDPFDVEPEDLQLVFVPARGHPERNFRNASE